MGNLKMPQLNTVQLSGRLTTERWENREGVVIEKPCIDVYQMYTLEWPDDNGGNQQAPPRRHKILRPVKESLDRLERTVPCVLDQIERDEDDRWRRVLGLVKKD